MSYNLCFLASISSINICGLTISFIHGGSMGYPFKNIFDFATAGDWDCVAALERLPALHYSVYFIFSSFGTWVSLWNFETIRGSLMRPK